MRRALRIAVLASGQGSNLRAIHQACEQGRLTSRIVGVFSDKPGCGAVRYAHENDLHCVAYSAQAFASKQDFERALFDEIDAVRPDLIICAGYMRIISPDQVSRFAGRMINLHPSLLPKFPGLNTHQRALEAGETEHGASVHCLTAELDAGPVIAASSLRIDNADTAETLRQRVQALEHPLLVGCVEAIERGSIRLDAMAEDVTAD